MSRKSYFFLRRWINVKPTLIQRLVSETLRLQVPLTQQSATEAPFSVQVPVLWNKLPRGIKAANSWTSYFF